jgi:hypothetical protein
LFCVSPPLIACSICLNDAAGLLVVIGSYHEDPAEAAGDVASCFAPAHVEEAGTVCSLLHHFIFIMVLSISCSNLMFANYLYLILPPNVLACNFLIN